jgi:hypothetical protein
MRILNNFVRSSAFRRFLFLIVMGLIAGICLAFSPADWIVTSANPATPIQLATNESIRARTLVFIGNKAARTVNAGTVWIQCNSTNDSPGIKLLSGQTISLTAGPGGFDLTNFWVDVETTNDGVTVMILQ